MEVAVSPIRDYVQRLEDAIAQMPQAECPVRNHFAPGIYAREMTIPKQIPWCARATCSTCAAPAAT